MAAAENAVTVKEVLVVRALEHRAPEWERAVIYSLDEKINGLNRAAKVRGKLFENKDHINGKKINHGMDVFLKEMRCSSNNRERENKRVLSAIFFLAEIEKQKHELDFCELNEDEQLRLIEAINQIKAVASIFPTDLAIK
ncbi:TPA: DUF5347 family protein [Morganella morganii]